MLKPLIACTQPNGALWARQGLLQTCPAHPTNTDVRLGGDVRVHELEWKSNGKTHDS